MKNHIEIGFIKRPKGLKGEVFAFINANAALFLSKGDNLVLEDEGRLKITSLKAYKEGYIFTFEGVSDRNQSDLLKGKKIFISNELAESFNSNNEVFLATLLNYEFYNLEEKAGKIAGFFETKAHDLVQIRLSDERLVELPWVSEFLVEINHSLKTVYFKAPVELLDPTFLEPGKK